MNSVRNNLNHKPDLPSVCSAYLRRKDLRSLDCACSKRKNEAIWAWRDGLISILKKWTDINFEEALEIQPWEAGACEGEGDGVGVDDVLQVVLHKLRTNLGHITVTESL